MKGIDAGFGPCPHCGKGSEFEEYLDRAYVICSDHNCWGGMEVRWGGLDDKDAFIGKMRRNWNRRAGTNDIGLKAAIQAVIRYKEMIEDENQHPYSDYDQLCVDVLDEAVKIMIAYTE